MQVHLHVDQQVVAHGPARPAGPRGRTSDSSARPSRVVRPSRPDARSTPRPSASGRARTTSAPSQSSASDADAAPYQAPRSPHVGGVQRQRPSSAVARCQLAGDRPHGARRGRSTIEQMMQLRRPRRRVRHGGRSAGRRRWPRAGRLHRRAGIATLDSMATTDGNMRLDRRAHQPVAARHRTCTASASRLQTIDLCLHRPTTILPRPSEPFAHDTGP